MRRRGVRTKRDGLRKGKRQCKGSEYTEGGKEGEEMGLRMETRKTPSRRDGFIVEGRHEPADGWHHQVFSPPKLPSGHRPSLAEPEGGLRCGSHCGRTRWDIRDV